MARIPFVRHLPVRKVRYKYRACRHPVEKVRWHALWLLARTDDPRSPAQVAGLVGPSDITVRAALHRWSAAGPDGAADGRKGDGSAPKLSARRRAALYAALQKRLAISGRRTAGCGPGRSSPGTSGAGGACRSAR